MKKLSIQTITSRDFAENSYIAEYKDKLIIIDPGCSQEELKPAIGNRQLAIVLLTHGHYDHIISLDYFKPEIVYAHINEKNIIENSGNNMSAFTGSPIEVKGINYYSGEKHTMDGIEFYHVPGHTAGCVLIKVENALFTGDTLFEDTIGRTDLYSGNMESMKKSLRIFSGFNPDIKCYPGHGRPFTLEYALENNPFIKR